MKKIVLTCAVVALVTAGALLACNSSKTPSTYTEGLDSSSTAAVAGMTSEESLISRGRYLVTIMGCNDCHSPKIMTPHGPDIDSAHMLSGHPAKMPVAVVDPKLAKDWVLFNPTLTAFVGPWGTSFAANLSSDATGIGNWSEEQFFRAIREGKYKGMENGRPLLPPMPWPMYRNATDEDLRAIFHFLKSTQPVENVVPAPVGPRG
jgi:hypothetical protein